MDLPIDTDHLSESDVFSTPQLAPLSHVGSPLECSQLSDPAHIHLLFDADPPDSLMEPLSAAVMRAKFQPSKPLASLFSASPDQSVGSLAPMARVEEEPLVISADGFGQVGADGVDILVAPHMRTIQPSSAISPARAPLLSPRVLSSLSHPPSQPFRAVTTTMSPCYPLVSPKAVANGSSRLLLMNQAATAAAHTDKVAHSVDTIVVSELRLFSANTVRSPPVKSDAITAAGESCSSVLLVTQGDNHPIVDAVPLSMWAVGDIGPDSPGEQLLCDPDSDHDDTAIVEIDVPKSHLLVVSSTRADRVTSMQNSMRSTDESLLTGLRQSNADLASGSKTPQHTQV